MNNHSFPKLKICGVKMPGWKTPLTSCTKTLWNPWASQFKEIGQLYQKRLTTRNKKAKTKLYCSAVKHSICHMVNVMFSLHTIFNILFSIHALDKFQNVCTVILHVISLLLHVIPQTFVYLDNVYQVRVTNTHFTCVQCCNPFQVQVQVHFIHTYSITI